METTRHALGVAEPAIQSIHPSGAQAGGCHQTNFFSPARRYQALGRPPKGQKNHGKGSVKQSESRDEGSSRVMGAGLSVPSIHRSMATTDPTDRRPACIITRSSAVQSTYQLTTRKIQFHKPTPSPERVKTDRQAPALRERSFFVRGAPQARSAAHRKPASEPALGTFGRPKYRVRPSVYGSSQQQHSRGRSSLAFPSTATSASARSVGGWMDGWMDGGCCRRRWWWCVPRRCSGGHAHLRATISCDAAMLHRPACPPRLLDACHQDAGGWPCTGDVCVWACVLWWTVWVV